MCGVNAKLRECGEFGEEDFEIFPYQNELEKIFDAFDGNDTQEMEEMFKLVGDIGAEDLNEEDQSDYKNDPIKYVVSLHQMILLILKLTLKSKMC